MKAPLLVVALLASLSTAFTQPFFDPNVDECAAATVASEPVFYLRLDDSRANAAATTHGVAQRWTADARFAAGEAQRPAYEGRDRFLLHDSEVVNSAHRCWRRAQWFGTQNHSYVDLDDQHTGARLGVEALVELDSQFDIDAETPTQAPQVPSGSLLRVVASKAGSWVLFVAATVNGIRPGFAWAREAADVSGVYAEREPWLFVGDDNLTDYADIVNVAPSFTSDFSQLSSTSGAVGIAVRLDTIEQTINFDVMLSDGTLESAQYSFDTALSPSAPGRLAHEPASRVAIGGYDEDMYTALYAHQVAAGEKTNTALSGVCSRLVCLPFVGVIDELYLYTSFESTELSYYATEWADLGQMRASALDRVATARPVHMYGFDATDAADAGRDGFPGFYLSRAESPAYDEATSASMATEGRHASPPRRGQYNLVDSVQNTTTLGRAVFFDGMRGASMILGEQPEAQRISGNWTFATWLHADRRADWPEMPAGENDALGLDTIVSKWGAGGGGMRLVRAREDHKLHLQLTTVNSSMARTFYDWSHNTVLDAGEWYHVAAVLHERVGATLYVNGVAQEFIYLDAAGEDIDDQGRGGFLLAAQSGQANAPTSTSGATEPADYSGGSYSATVNYWNGALDEVTIYRRAVPAWEFHEMLDALPLQVDRVCARVWRIINHRYSHTAELRWDWASASPSKWYQSDVQPRFSGSVAPMGVQDVIMADHGAARGTLHLWIDTINFDKRKMPLPVPSLDGEECVIVHPVCRGHYRVSSRSWRHPLRVAWQTDGYAGVDGERHAPMTLPPRYPPLFLDSSDVEQWVPELPSTIDNAQPSHLTDQQAYVGSLIDITTAGRADKETLSLYIVSEQDGFGERLAARKLHNGMSCDKGAMDSSADSKLHQHRKSYHRVQGEPRPTDSNDEVGAKDEEIHPTVDAFYLDGFHESDNSVIEHANQNWRAETLSGLQPHKLVTIFSFEPDRTIQSPERYWIEIHVGTGHTDDHLFGPVPLLDVGAGVRQRFEIDLCRQLSGGTCLSGAAIVARIFRNHRTVRPDVDSKDQTVFPTDDPIDNIEANIVSELTLSVPSTGLVCLVPNLAWTFGATSSSDPSYTLDEAGLWEYFGRGGFLQLRNGATTEFGDFVLTTSDAYAFSWHKSGDGNEDASVFWSFDFENLDDESFDSTSPKLQRVGGHTFSTWVTITAGSSTGTVVSLAELSDTTMTWDALVYEGGGIFGMRSENDARSSPAVASDPNVGPAASEGVLLHVVASMTYAESTATGDVGAASGAIYVDGVLQREWQFTDDSHFSYWDSQQVMTFGGRFLHQNDDFASRFDTAGAQFRMATFEYFSYPVSSYDAETLFAAGFDLTRCGPTFVPPPDPTSTCASMDTRVGQSPGVVSFPCDCDGCAVNTTEEIDSSFFVDLAPPARRIVSCCDADSLRYGWMGRYRHAREDIDAVVLCGLNGTTTTSNSIPVEHRPVVIECAYTPTTTSDGACASYSTLDAVAEDDMVACGGNPGYRFEIDSARRRRKRTEVAKRSEAEQQLSAHELFSASRVQKRDQCTLTSKSALVNQRWYTNVFVPEEAVFTYEMTRMSAVTYLADDREYVRDACAPTGGDADANREEADCSSSDFGAPCTILSSNYTTESVVSCCDGTPADGKLLVFLHNAVTHDARELHICQDNGDRPLSTTGRPSRIGAMGCSSDSATTNTCMDYAWTFSRTEDTGCSAGTGFTVVYEKFATSVTGTSRRRKRDVGSNATSSSVDGELFDDATATFAKRNANIDTLDTHGPNTCASTELWMWIPDEFFTWAKTGAGADGFFGYELVFAE